jgi:hypothetical protein
MAGMRGYAMTLVDVSLRLLRPAGAGLAMTVK